MLNLPILGVAAAIGGGFAKEMKLKDSAQYAVKRKLLEKSYPAFKSFKGLMYSGLMPAAKLDSNNDDFSSYFFVLLRPDGKNDEPQDRTDETFRDDTLLIWLNGGPGCSSMTGMVGEMGPVGTPKFGPGVPSPNPAPMVKNEYAWTKKSAMLFVEQPGGVGFSSASTNWTGLKADERTEHDVASSFYDFLQNIYAVFGDELAKKKVYISGESYAGMYIPAIARWIHIQNKRILNSTSVASALDASVVPMHHDKMYSSPMSRVIMLRGIVIGNGWIDAKIQGPTTIDFAWWHGMIDLQDHRTLHAKWNDCINRQILDSSEVPFHPFNVPDECGITTAVMKASGSEFMYDVTETDAYPGILDEGGALDLFFNDPVVRTSLNAPSMEEHPHWMGCVPGAGRRRRMERIKQRELTVLDHDGPLSVVPYIAELLDDANLDILLYNGDLDLACPPQSTELALDSMVWSGAEGWKDHNVAQWDRWTVDEQPAGHTKSFKNLQFLVVYNSGHFVPINQPRRSLNMIGRLLDRKKLGDKSLPNFDWDESTVTTQNENIGAQQLAGTTRKYEFNFLAGLICFFLGVWVSHLVAAKRSTNSKLNESPPPSPHMLQLITEESPLFFEEKKTSFNDNGSS